MFVLNDDMSIYTTRGDVVFFAVLADTDEGEAHTFKPGDVVRMKIFNKKNCDEVVLQKDFPVFKESEQVEIILTKEDTKLGKVVSKPTDFWYEIELNPDTEMPQTLIGYSEDGPAVFKVLPEGADLEEYIPTEDDIPFVDTELDLTSPRPVANRAISARIVNLERGAKLIQKLESTVSKLESSVSQLESKVAQLGEKITLLEDQIENSGGGTGGVSDISYTESTGIVNLPDVDKMKVVGTCSGYTSGGSVQLLLLSEYDEVIAMHELSPSSYSEAENADVNQTITIPSNARSFVTAPEQGNSVGSSFDAGGNWGYTCNLTISFNQETGN